MKCVHSKSLNFDNTLKLIMQSTQGLKCVCGNYFIIKTNKKCRPSITTNSFDLHCVEISYIEVKTKVWRTSGVKTFLCITIYKFVMPALYDLLGHQTPAC